MRLAAQARARAHRDALALEGDHEAARLDPREGHVQKARQAPLGVARPGDHRPRQALEQARAQPLAQPREPARLARPALGGELQGAREAHDAGDVLRAGAHAALLPAAVDERAQPDVVRGPEGAHLLGAVDLGRGEREQVDAERAHVDGEGAGRLRGVRMQVDGRALARLEAPRALGGHGAGDLAHGLHAAELPVGELHRDELGLRADRPRHGGGVHEAVAPPRARCAERGSRRRRARSRARWRPRPRAPRPPRRRGCWPPSRRP